MNRLELSLRPQRGFTALEALLSVAVSAIALGAAAPSFQSARATRQIEGAAAQLETDIQLARSLAVSRNAPVRLSFKSDAQGTCYVIHTGPANACQCDSRGLAVCAPGVKADRSLRFEAAHPVQVKSNSPSLVFDAAKGTVSPTGTMRITGSQGRGVNLVVNIMGRVRACSPGQTVRGYAKC